MSAEFLANWGPNFVNAEEAWARGYTGAGITIGVIDDGIHPNHPELVGRVSPLSVDIVPGRNALTTDQSHGSELSSLMVGNFNNLQTVGIAFDATVLAIRADSGAGGFDYDDLTAAVNYAVANGVDIINFSLGGDSPAPQSFVDALTAATAAGVIVVVSAGNDGGQPGVTDVGYPGRYASNLSISHGLIISTGGLNSDGSPNLQSNPPGTTVNWYLMAPGWQTIVPDYGPPGPVPGFQTCGLGPNGDLCRIQGTSYASPQVSAGIALLMQAAPGLTPAQLVDLVLTTAFDAGAPGTDGIYGRGIFDIARAFQPVGPLAFATASGDEALASAAVGAVGAAYGDAFTDQGAWTSTAFDSYGRSFEVSLAHGWSGAAQRDIANEGAPALWRAGEAEGPIVARFVASEELPPEALRGRMREEPEGAFRARTALSEDIQLTFAANAPAIDPASPGAESGHLGFAGVDLAVAAERDIGGAQLAFTSQSGEADLGQFGTSRRRAMAVRLADQIGALRISGTYGVLTEEGALLGLVWDDAWGAAPNGVTQFVGFALGWSPLSNLEFGLSGEVARATLDGGGWLTLEAPLITTTASAGVRWSVAPAALRRRGFAGALTLAFSQPLRVEDGVFGALVPMSDAWGIHHLAFDQRLIAASPSGRELETRLSYWLWSSAALAAHIDLAHRQEPGHRADAEDAAEALIGLSMAY